MARILGIEIADAHIRTALLHAGFRKLALERVDEIAIEGENEEERESSIASSIRRLLSGMERAPDSVAIALDGRELSLRQLEFPIGTLKRIPELLPFEIEGLLPFDVEGAILSYQESARTEDTVNVLAAAAPKELIRTHLEQYRSYGVEPRYLCPGAAALDGLVPLIPALSDDAPTLLLAIHDESADLAVIKGGKNVFARTLSRGRRALESSGNGAFFAELRATIAAYRAQGGERPIRAHLLIGDLDERLPPELKTKLNDSLGLEPEPLPLPPTSTGAEVPLRFAFAVALAGRGADREPRIDLRRGEFAPPRTSGMLLRHWKLLAACLAAILASFIFSIVMRQSILESERDRLREKLAMISKDLLGEEVRSASRARALLGGSLIPDDPMPRFDAFDALDTVSREMPSEIVHHLRKFVVEIDDEARDGKLEMHGRVSSITERDQLAQALEAADCFERVNPGPTSPARGGEEGLNYRLDIDIRCERDDASAERRP